MGLADDLGSLRPASKTIVSHIERLLDELDPDAHTALQQVLSDRAISATDIARALVRNGHLTHLSDPAQSVRKYRAKVLTREPV
jgi:hypothetical protein